MLLVPYHKLLQLHGGCLLCAVLRIACHFRSLLVLLSICGGIVYQVFYCSLLSATSPRRYKNRNGHYISTGVCALHINRERLLHMKLFFQPVDIQQHTTSVRAGSSVLERRNLCGHIIIVEITGKCEERTHEGARHVLFVFRFSFRRFSPS